MFIPPYRFINFEQLFMPSYRFIILRNFPTYMFIPPYRFINFDEFFQHTYMIGQCQPIEIYCYDRVDKEGSRMEGTLDFDSFDLGANF